ncbi:hypothetical protein E4U17_003868 [Claviceps sp. LM77 group G4]|nr:hypothetical protein E4U17_003868 [Claviceps sp. LM77 group G4]
MTPLGSKRPAPMAEQLATAEPDDHGRIHLTLKRQKRIGSAASATATVIMPDTLQQPRPQPGYI